MSSSGNSDKQSAESHQRQFNTTTPRMTYLFRVDRERSFTLTIRTITNLHLLRRVLVKRSQHSPTLLAVKLDILQLREHTTASCHDPIDTDEVVEVGSAEVAQGRAEGEVRDADVDFGVDAPVCGVVDEDGVERDFVEDFEHGCGGVGEEVGEDGF